MTRRLVATVFVGDVAYGPGSDVSDDVAAQITNPAAWEDDEAVQEPEKAPQGSRSAPVATNADPGDQRAELEAMDRDDLAALAKAHGLNARGSKSELVDRLSQT
jgi:hypothetical protein